MEIVISSKDNIQLIIRILTNENAQKVTRVLNEYKCDRCGFVNKALIRPHLCKKCSAPRKFLHKIEAKPPAALQGGK